MSANVHRLLLQPGRCFLSTAFWIIFPAMLVLWGKQHGPSTQPWAFLFCGMLLPFALGATLATMLHEPMHRPFGLLLPRARNRFLRSHAAIVGGIALGLGCVAHLVDRSLPLVPLVGSAAAALSFTLPFEPGWRWAGSRPGAILATAAFGIFLWSAVPVRSAVLDHPWLCGSAAFALTGMNFAVAFSMARRRQRAMTPFTSVLSTIYDPAIYALRKKEDTARSRTSRSRWGRSLAGGSVRFWIAALRHERLPSWRGSLSWGPLMVILPLLATLRSEGGVGETIMRKVFAAALEGKGPLMTYPFYFAVLVMMQGIWAPRAGWLYPIPRAQQARVTFAVSGWQIAGNFGLLALALLSVAGMAAWQTGLPFPAGSVGRTLLSLALMLPLLPLVQWCLLHVQVRQDRAKLLLSGILIVATMMVWGWQPFNVHWTSQLMTPGGIAGCAAVVGASQWAYYAALRRFYREGDLLQHGTSRRNFSLV
jgi:hypothetical protein